MKSMTGKYSKGKETYNKIFTSAKKYFYTQGYTETTFRKLSSETGIHLGQFTYYFKTKDNLAGLIYSEIRRNTYDLFKDKYGEYNDPKKSLVLNLAFDILLLASNKKYGSFFYEFSKGSTYKEYHSNLIEDSLRFYPSPDKSLYEEPRHKLHLNMVAIPGIKPFLIHETLNNKYKIPETEICRYYVELFLALLGEKEIEIGELYDFAYNEYMKLDLKIGNSFKLNYNREYAKSYRET